MTIVIATSRVANLTAEDEKRKRTAVKSSSIDVVWLWEDFLSHSMCETVPLLLVRDELARPFDFFFVQW